MRVSPRLLLPLVMVGFFAFVTACVTGPDGQVDPMGVAPEANPGGTAMTKALEVRGRLFPKKDGLCELDLRVSNIEPTVDYEIRITDSEGPVILDFEPQGNTRNWFSVSLIDKSAEYWASYARYLELWGMVPREGAIGTTDLRLILKIDPSMINNRCF